MTLTVRPGIMDIAPYVPGEGSLAGQTRVIRLASNENPLGPSPLAMEAYRTLSPDLHRYPDGGARMLTEALAAAYDLEPDRIVTGAGSDELITMLTRAYAGPGDEVLYSQYGFLMYAITARTVGATPIAAPERDLTTDVDALLAHVTPRTRILYLANPNNPTGSRIPNIEVERLHAALPASVLLVLDSAYAEYVTAPDYDSGIKLARQHGNVVMLRTFSKIYGLAGLRIGWAYGPKVVMDVLHRVRGPFNTAVASQAAAVAALGDLAHVERSRAHNDRWLPWFRDQVNELGFRAFPSDGNFVLVRFASAEGATAACAFLNARGIIPRPMGAYRLNDCLRITVGLQDELQAVVDALAAFADERYPADKRAAAGGHG
jgi:histidinol-phosphate aminotransferase